MRSQEKPFVHYEGGALPYLIAPRGWKGWSQFAAWFVLLTPLLAWLVKHMQTPQNSTDFGSGLFLFLMGFAIWLVAGVWWMLGRVEVIRVVEIKRKAQYARRKLAREQAQAQAQQQNA